MNCIYWEQPLKETLALAGRKDFTAQLYGKVRYAMTDNWALDLGYKAVWVDYETGIKGQRDYFAYDTVTHGPQLGIIYKF